MKINVLNLFNNTDKTKCSDKAKSNNSNNTTIYNYYNKEVVDLYKEMFL